MASWPGTLPQSFLVDSLSFQHQKGADASPTDVGPTITRQRFTAASTFFQGDMIMTPTQFATLESFYKSTLFMGSQKFDWVHPLVGGSVQMRFDLSQQEDYSIKQIIRPLRWMIHMAFEILP